MTDELKQWEYDRGYEKGKADVLDKIRAEIETLESPFGSYGEWYDGRADCLKIIDKYRKEQE